MTILVDMDDVLEELLKRWTSFLNKRYGTCVTKDDIRDWNVGAAFPMLTREQVYGPEKEEDEFWEHVEPMAGADENLRRLIADGHEIYVVTATEYRTLKSKMDNVLFKYFPYISWDNVIITKRKQMIRGDVLVDDGPHNFPGGEYRGILFDAPHNQSFDESSIGAVRAHNWDEVYSIICQMNEFE